MRSRVLGLLALVASALVGCAGDSDLLKGLAGVPATPSPPRPSGETRWVLVQNPRFGATMAEPEYIWVEDDRIPGTLTTLMFGKQAIVATPEMLWRYPPPEGATISPLQAGSAPASRVDAPPPAAPRTAAVAPEKPRAVPSRGYVVHVREGLIVVDLTAADGIKKGSLLGLRREGVALKHPVTGEHLGELDEEIGTARVVEIQDRFSVAEVEGTRPGVEPRVKDRVLVKEP
ncbi:MAG: hypothetical protein HYV62_12125 [Candidatus Rokubacteria bacterium]|nr:hypothetical protein [Candidatus Rokubacteria bacterium]